MNHFWIPHCLSQPTSVAAFELIISEIRAETVHFRQTSCLVPLLSPPETESGFFKKRKLLRDKEEIQAMVTTGNH